MPVLIDEIVVDVPPPETSSGQRSRDVQGAANATPTPAWTPEFASMLDQQLGIALERRARLLAD
ncbi:hypothetical protein J2X20_004610 [Pelomonas saccharophila]|uniref:Uncharacterized protein n=1 Tax=Roseateles saccharophilus TaxID=304 RepID=A0ABU1YSW0_ROSSA|nr:hypothetical protein [Roseateles saccharophilus]MDR7271936.1 hypothetical protein [Roseateles saccharophilus]